MAAANQASDRPCGYRNGWRIAMGAGLSAFSECHSDSESSFCWAPSVKFILCVGADSFDCQFGVCTCSPDDPVQWNPNGSESRRPTVGAFEYFELNAWDWIVQTEFSGLNSLHALLHKGLHKGRLPHSRMNHTRKGSTTSQKWTT